MLKKLLASALAVATVASCAYVPTALASAATTYETADAVDYAIWELNNPAATEEKIDVTVYVAGNVTGAMAKAETINVKVADNNVETIKAELAKRKGIDKETATDLVKHEIVAVSATASQTVYVAHINETQAVVYSEYNEAAQKPASTSANDLAAKDVKLLGYYDTPVDATAVLADMYSKVANAKLADKEFAYWAYADGVVAPVYKAQLAENTIYYTDVTLYWAATGASTGAELVAGTYALTGKIASAPVVKLPNNDRANWTTYLNNFAKLNGWYTIIVNTSDKEPVAYEMAGVRLVATNKYAAIYTPVATAAAKETVNYTLHLFTKGETVKDDVVIAKFSGEISSAEAYYTTDLEAIYAICKDSKDADANKDTLAAWLVQGKDTGASIYALTGEIRSTEVSKFEKDVTVAVYVEKAVQYTVYSFAEGDKVVKSTAYLTASQVAPTEYKNIDATTQLVVTKPVISATAADLGVATEATVNGVPAAYAYAEVPTGYVINTTYKMGDATAAMADFETTTGEFNSEAYFCRDAKAGDVVTLKVSLSATGVAKGLDYTKISVAYNVVGATAGENYVYSGSELYKDGMATDVTLAAGTNIVTATVSYNGVVIGTFAPFYAYVG